MGKEIQKFLPVAHGMIEKPVTLLELKGSSSITCQYLQAIGIEDAGKGEIYEGSVLELRITDELMDPNKNMFYNSNLGKAMSKDRSITSVVCVMHGDNVEMQCGYKVYFANKDGVTLDDEGKPDVQASGYEVLFPSYLCEKGAMIIGNAEVDKDILDNFNKYSYWNENLAIKVVTINCNDVEVEHTWGSLHELRTDWFSDNCSAPSLDDPLVSATVFGEDVTALCGDSSGSIFKGVMEYLESVTRYAFL